MNEESYITIVDRASSHKIDVLFQEEVQLDINVPLFYIKSGEEEVKHYVEKVCKPDIDNFVENKKDTTLKYIDKHTNDFAIKAIEICADEKIGVIANYVSEAENSAQLSSQRASDALNYATISAEQAEIVQNNNKQIEETINRLDIKKKITNCITEIPQDIKLELIDGRLTLKAGSKVYVPNGFEADGVTPKFDYVIIESDLSTNTGWAPSGQNFLFYDSVNKTFSMYAHNYGNCSIWSGDSPTIDKQYGMWFNTTNNIIQNTNNTGSSWAGKFSLPLTIYTCDSNKKPASIEQIFNGFGYVGSTMFVLPGVKGLIPNGRNEDGSLRNIEVKFDMVKIGTLFYGAQDYYICINTNKDFAFAGKTITEYQESKNLVYDIFAGLYTDWGMVGSIRGDANNQLSNFTPKQAFHAVDRNDRSWMAQQAMPSGKYIDLTLGASGSTYTAPANGYFAISKQAGGTGQYHSLANVTAHMSIAGTPNFTGAGAEVFIPAKRNDKIKVNYTTTGNAAFRFIYAEGEE